MAGRVPSRPVLLDVRRQLGEGKHPRGVDDDGKPQTADERKGDFRRDADPDRRGGAPEGVWWNPQSGTTRVISPEGETHPRPPLCDELQRLREAAPAVRE